MLTDIILSFVIGGSVGIIGHVRKYGKIIMPRKTKRFIYLGFLEELLLGAVAALLLVLYAAPNSLVEIIIFSIIAGIGGDAVLNRFKLLKQDSDK
ncbi:DUF4257 domain-containing protein [Neobacillus vireti]|uniref:DUF4257 domain-containing protein n=1 Tax=Neobacillus vireti LMG 21834 TaxID=1131730 RepID=A0AB94IKM3_9BACI|nr:DUF4257 domain-containing protein [Neobacillus vireti]ETI67616.1 hypothetical protein BAVI_16727 [Neobacillus vireti LMG 21834]KLT19638.1 hypothetical protein AA980_03335 [Neobacillus vireti]